MVAQREIRTDLLCYNPNALDSLQREQLVRSELQRCSSVVIAFSGGVDSSYLAFLAVQSLGTKAFCLTGLSAAVSGRQRRLAERFAALHGLNHRFLDTSELDRSEYRRNPGNRCYFCKSELYHHLERFRREVGAALIMDGSNADDLSDYRPGRQAAAELNVRSPLAETGMSKSMIRERSRTWGLETWDLPAMPCLASRFPYGTEIDPDRLLLVEKSEEILWELGFRNFRVRYHGEIARLEIAREEMSRLDAERTSHIDRELRALGFSRVEVDRRGFRSGSLNETLLQLDS